MTAGMKETENRRCPRYRVLCRAGGCAMLLIDAQNKPIDTDKDKDVFQARTDGLSIRRSSEVSWGVGNDLM